MPLGLRIGGGSDCMCLILPELQREGIQYRNHHNNPPKATLQGGQSEVITDNNMNTTQQQQKRHISQFSKTGSLEQGRVGENKPIAGHLDYLHWPHSFVFTLLAVYHLRRVTFQITSTNLYPSTMTRYRYVTWRDVTCRVVCYFLITFFVLL